MKKIMFWIIRMLLLLLIILLAFFFGKNILASFKTPQSLMFYLKHPFFLGITIYFFIYIILIRGKITIWDTLEHELTHALFAILTFNKIDSIAVNKSGGEVRYSGQGRNFLITLSPYFFPTFLILILPLKLLIAIEYKFIMDIIIGFLFLYYVLSTVKEAHFKQPDLHIFGLFYSYSFIIAANILILSSVVILEYRNWQNLIAIWQDTYKNLILFWQNLI